MSFRKHTRIGWMLVSALFLASTAGACVGFVPGAIGGGILVMVVSAGLLLFGACGGRALTGDDARVGPCLRLGTPSDGPVDSPVGPCLSILPRFDANPDGAVDGGGTEAGSDVRVGACLSIDVRFGPCLSFMPPDAAQDVRVGPCLSPPMPSDAARDVRVGPCLSIDASFGPCLSLVHAPSASAAHEPAPSPALHRSPEQDRELAIAKLHDRLPADLQSRLGGRAKS